ncbi:hypothetical protein GO730_38845 [Spirosoma sp. HMF3257]|uniref:DUF2493 domain-containing protein n=1 Tax=Spirosoma telluris TaxID=2183553 RepID=A0A327NC94_9BACT|nr:hypothetical protein [Spirosoma telluris]RAI72860.1 hypothetical protein HMF3257_38770 [Spirosoma telluris]
MKTALLASRQLTSADCYAQVKTTLDQAGTTELHHGAEGAGKELAERWAKETGHTESGHTPDWKQYGRAAGPIRGKALIGAVDNVVALWDGKSKGTENELKEARRQGKPVRLILVQSH